MTPALTPSVLSGIPITGYRWDVTSLGVRGNVERVQVELWVIRGPHQLHCNSLIMDRDVYDDLDKLGAFNHTGMQRKVKIPLL